MHACMHTVSTIVEDSKEFIHPRGQHNHTKLNRITSIARHADNDNKINIFFSTRPRYFWLVILGRINSLKQASERRFGCRNRRNHPTRKKVYTAACSSWWWWWLAPAGATEVTDLFTKQLEIGYVYYLYVYICDSDSNCKRRRHNCQFSVSLCI